MSKSIDVACKYKEANKIIENNKKNVIKKVLILKPSFIVKKKKPFLVSNISLLR